MPMTVKDDRLTGDTDMEQSANHRPAARQLADFAFMKLCVVTAIFVDVSCNSKSVVNINNTQNVTNNTNVQEQAPDPQVDATTSKSVVSGSAILIERTYYQTRNVVTVKLAGLNEQDAIVLKNETTNSTFANMTFSSGVVVDDFKVWQFFPTSAAPGKFAYGINHLKTYVNDDEAPESLQIESFTLKDFTYFALGTSTFVNAGLGQQSQGYQGRNAWIMGSTVQTKEDQMTTGTIAVLNQ